MVVQPLPQDIIDYLMDFLDLQTLKTTRLVHSLFDHACRQRIFKNVTLYVSPPRKSEPRHLFRPIFSPGSTSSFRLSLLLDSSPDIIPLIKALCLRDAPDVRTWPPGEFRDNDSQYLLLILERLTHLCQIEIRCTTLARWDELQTALSSAFASPRLTSIQFINTSFPIHVLYSCVSVRHLTLENAAGFHPVDDDSEVAQLPVRLQSLKIDHTPFEPAPLCFGKGEPFDISQLNHLTLDIDSDPDHLARGEILWKTYLQPASQTLKYLNIGTDCMSPLTIQSPGLKIPLIIVCRVL